MDLAELDLLHIVQVPGGPQHQEQRVAVVLQLRALVAGERVLHRQMAQVEFLGHRTQLVRVRTVEPDPGHALALPQEKIRLIQILGVRGPVAVHVHGIVHDGHGDAPPPQGIPWL